MKIRVDKMKTAMIFFLIIVLAVSLFGADIALAGNDKLTELEAQQLKILKLSKVVEEQPCPLIINCCNIRGFRKSFNNFLI